MSKVKIIYIFLQYIFIFAYFKMFYNFTVTIKMSLELLLIASY